MSEPAFNLVDEPWIGVLRRDGKTDEVSLLDLVARGDEFTQIVGDVPTQVFAIQRLVLAVLHRALGGPDSVDHWRSVSADWPAAVAAVDAYLRRHRDRFFLFHPETPFFQVAGLRTAKGEVSGLEKLIADVPNGAPYFTTRIGPGLDRISAAEAARWLVHVHAFDPSGIRSGALGDDRVKGGRGYPIGAAWSGLLGGVSIVGDTVRETLELNLVVPEFADVQTGTEDLPSWEREPLTSAVEDLPGRSEPRGLIELYTWQSRRVRLVGGPDGVTALVLAQGDAMAPQNRQRLEPMTAWRYSEPQTKKFGRTTYMPREHIPERQFWRGLAALLPYVPAEKTKEGIARTLPPGIVRWVSALREELPDKIIRLRATGIQYGGQSATVAEIVDDQLALPLSLLGEDGAELELDVVEAVARADRAVSEVSLLAKNVAMAAGAGPDDNGPSDRAREQVYAALDGPFREWLLGLSLDEESLAAQKRWQQTVRRIALTIGGDLIAAAGEAAWVGREVRGEHMDSGLAEVRFRSKLRRALPYGDPQREVA